MVFASASLRVYDGWKKDPTGHERDKQCGVPGINSPSFHCWALKRDWGTKVAHEAEVKG